MKKDFQKWSHEKLLHEYKELLKRKKFGIVWEDKPEAVAEQCKDFLPVLKEQKGKEILDDKDTINHIFIEADNYHALSVLNYTHKKSIDIIYIDPPYNNGKKSWQYNNDYVDKEDRFMHSKWLSFMSKRLRLAKNLLTENGVLICAVDHNEQEALGLLLREIFSNREIVCVTIVHNPGGIQGNNFSYTHEYAYFVYPSGKRFIALQNREDTPDIRPLRDVSKGNHLRTDAANCFYPILVKNEEIIGFGDVCPDNFHPKSVNVKRKDGVMEIYPIDPQGNERKWVFSRQKVETIEDELTIEYNKRRKIWDVIRKKTALNYKTVWTDKKYNANVYGTKLLAKIIDVKFPYPKSLYTVEDCINAIVHDKDKAVILDFFAGSGTTGHAVLELNKKDNGHRQFILCTNNEDNNGSGTKIASDICYPRIKKIIKGYSSNDTGEKVHGLGGNLRYYTTEFVNKVKTDNDKRIFTARSTEMLCLAEGTFNEVINKKNAFSIYKNEGKMTAIIYDEDAIEDFKKEVKKHKLPLVVYVFSYDHTYDEEDFENLVNLRTIKPIPEIILNVYRKIYKETNRPKNL